MGIIPDTPDRRRGAVKGTPDQGEPARLPVERSRSSRQRQGGSPGPRNGQGFKPRRERTRSSTPISTPDEALFRPSPGGRAFSESRDGWTIAPPRGAGPVTDEDRSGRPWSPEETSYLRWAYSQGQSLGHIAQHLGRTTASVKQRAYRLDLPAHPRFHSRQLAPRRDDLASRLADLQGLSPEAEERPEPLRDEALERFLRAPTALFSWLGVLLFPYQEEGLSLIQGRDRTALVWGRQTGKDTLTGLYGLYTALVTPGSIVICVSPSQRQSDLWMEKLKGYALSRPEIRDAVTDLSQSELALSNGSRVYSLPSGVGGGVTIRGFSRVSLLVFNEAAWVAEEVYQAAGPFLAASEGGKVVLISTPFGQSGYLWRAWNSPLFAKLNIPSSASPLISDAFLATERETMDALSYASEYDARFLSSQNAYFPTELVQGCVQAYRLTESPLREHEGLTFTLGCDWGRVEGGDRTVLTVVGIDHEGRGKVLWLKPFEGTDYVQQAAYVAWLHGLWRFKRIHADASNHAVVDALRAKSLPVDPVAFTAPSKAELYGRLKAAMEAGRLVLPDHRDLLRELVHLRVPDQPARQSPPPPRRRRPRRLPRFAGAGGPRPHETAAGKAWTRRDADALRARDRDPADVLAPASATTAIAAMRPLRAGD